MISLHTYHILIVLPFCGLDLLILRLRESKMGKNYFRTENMSYEYFGIEHEINAS